MSFGRAQNRVPSGTTRAMRVAIVGCGQISDAHLQELRKIPSLSIVAACDAHIDLAMQAAKRFDVPRYYDDVGVMLQKENPSVVRIATPVLSYVQLALQCIEAGAHVVIAKSMALDAGEAREILSASKPLRRKVCVSHDQLFDPTWLELQRSVALGEIGTVRHVESVLGYPLTAQFGCAVTADDGHWVRKLPGWLFQNTICHPLYRITEFLTNCAIGPPSSLYERYLRNSRGQLPGVISRSQTQGFWQPVRYSSQKAKNLLAWSPRVPMADALQQAILAPKQQAH